MTEPLLTRALAKTCLNFACSKLLKQTIILLRHRHMTEQLSTQVLAQNCLSKEIFHLVISLSQTQFYESSKTKIKICQMVTFNFCITMAIFSHNFISELSISQLQRRNGRMWKHGHHLLLLLLLLIRADSSKSKSSRDGKCNDQLVKERKLKFGNFNIIC